LLATVSLGLAPGICEGLPPSPQIPPARRSADTSTIDAVRHLLHGIPQSGDALGYANAPVTLQVFGDLECPICKELALGVQARLIQRYVRTRKLKLEDRSLETATRAVKTFRAQQVAALAAGRQDKLWDFVELFYREQGQEDSGYVTNAFLQGIAQQVPGLSLSAWNAARKVPALTEMLNRDEQVANRSGFTGTPSLLIGHTGGHLREFEPASLQRAASFEAAINRLLRSGR
jgi:protein-disulfide isomerase